MEDFVHPFIKYTKVVGAALLWAKRFCFFGYVYRSVEEDLVVFQLPHGDGMVITLQDYESVCVVPEVLRLGQVWWSVPVPSSSRVSDMASSSGESMWHRGTSPSVRHRYWCLDPKIFV